MEDLVPGYEFSQRYHKEGESIRRRLGKEALGILPPVSDTAIKSSSAGLGIYAVTGNPEAAPVGLLAAAYADFKLKDGRKSVSFLEGYREGKKNSGDKAVLMEFANSLGRGSRRAEEVFKGIL